MDSSPQGQLVSSIFGVTAVSFLLGDVGHII